MIYVERDRAVVADDVRRVPAARSRLLACGRRGAYRTVPGRFGEGSTDPPRSRVWSP